MEGGGGLVEVEAETTGVTLVELDVDFGSRGAWWEEGGRRGVENDGVQVE